MSTSNTISPRTFVYSLSHSSNYVDQATALAQNLTFATDTSFIMRADSFTTLDPNGPGRNSVRIQSNNVYNTHVSVYVPAPFIILDLGGS